jgi:pimeloyl-ACP methyl ester carboxylesterase
MVLGGPGGWLQRWSFRWAQHIAQADFSAVRPQDLIPKIPAPLMVIRSEADVFIDEAHAAIVASAATKRPCDLLTVYWNAQNAHHVAALEQDPSAYRQRIETFLNEAEQRMRPAAVNPHSPESP